MSLRKILIVDDDPDILMITEMVLSENEELNIKTAENGEQALQTCSEWLPDMVLMDMKMPLLDGLSALGRLKKDKSLNHIPVIMVTANSLEESQDECIHHGAQAVIVKPFNPLTLYGSLINEWEKHLDSSKKAI